MDLPRAGSAEFVRSELSTVETTTTLIGLVSFVVAYLVVFRTKETEKQGVDHQQRVESLLERIAVAVEREPRTPEAIDRRQSQRDLGRLATREVGIHERDVRAERFLTDMPVPLRHVVLRVPHVVLHALLRHPRFQPPRHE